MKNFIKFGLVGFAGYLVGFYECKYRMLDMMWNSVLEADKNQKKGEGAQ